MAHRAAPQDDGDVDETPVGQLCEAIAEGKVAEASGVCLAQQLSRVHAGA